MKAWSIVLGLMCIGSGARAEELSGTWTGAYEYRDGAGESVSHTYQLCIRDGLVAGSSSEPRTFGDATSSELKARVSGTLSAGQLRFRKTYDGTAGVRHSVDYSGKLSGDRVVGTWTIGQNTGGSFSLQLRPGTAASAGCALDRRVVPAAKGEGSTLDSSLVTDTSGL